MVNYESKTEAGLLAHGIEDRGDRKEGIAVIDGAREGVRALDMAAGALVVFRGRTALHRVTPVEGAPPRLLAVLSYDREPGKTLAEHTRQIFYGRVA